MPGGAVSAGIGAVGSIGGGIASGKGAKKAAKLQAKVAEEQLAAQRQYYNESVARYQPEIQQGNSALALQDGLLGVGGDSNASAAAFAQWKKSTDYQNTLKGALDGVNASAYSAGLARSGFALKALQDRAATVANGSLQQYLGNLAGLTNVGTNAKNALSGAAQVNLAANNQTLQNQGDSASNAALARANSQANLFQNLGNLASSAFQSSYTPSFKLDTQAANNAILNAPGIPRGGIGF